MNFKLLIALTIVLLSTNFSLGQDENNYNELVNEAWSLYESEDYKQSAEKYEMAFDESNGKGNSYDRYNAACSHALAGDVKSSFSHLFYLAEHSKIKYNNLNHISNDTDLNALHSNRKWKKLIKIVAANKEEYEKNLDKPLVAILDTIYQEDQKYRVQLEEIEKEFGWKSDEVRNQWDLISERDSINRVQIKKILDERGWLGADVIGVQGNSTLFFVIQHSDHETQLEYLPMMREAVKLGNANASSLALLEDRVALGEGKRQIYGSQIGTDQETGELFVSPLIEPEKVNERRAEVGLGTIEEYVGIWDLVWDIEKHKERTKQIESQTVGY